MENNSDMEREFKNRQKKGMAQLKKAKESKPEFEQLDYPGKLKFMDDNFDGISGISDKNEMIISVYPNEKDPDQIRQFNERFIQRIEKFESELFNKYSFDRLKAGFFADIEKIRETNPVPGDLVREYIEKEIETYSGYIQTPFIKKEMDFYKGNWDLSKKIIETSFLMARAYSNYLPFLKGELKKGVSMGQTERTFPEYLINIPEEKKTWFAVQLKKEFRSERGIQIRFMIEGLISLNLLTLARGQWKSFINAMNNFFDQDIGKYQGIQNPKLLYKEDIESAEKRIQPILDQIIKD